LDLSEVCVLEGGGLGMLLFLQRWAYEHGIGLKIFNPRKSVRNRLQDADAMAEVDIASLDEVMALLVSAEQHCTLVM
jgi:hypothetical protein